MALRPVYEDPLDALYDVGDGASIALGGFTAALGAPKVLFQALMQTAAKDLTFIGNGTPQVMLGEGEQRRFLIFDAARVRKVICSFPGGGAARATVANPYEQAFTDGSVELELVPQGTLAAPRLRPRQGPAGGPAGQPRLPQHGAQLQPAHGGRGRRHHRRGRGDRRAGPAQPGREHAAPPLRPPPGPRDE